MNTKQNLITVLNQCVFNKPLHEFNAITNFIRSIQPKHITINSIEHDTKDIDIGYEGINITLWTEYQGKCKVLSIVFNNSQYIAFNQVCGCQYAMFNSVYNVQYEEIKDLLLSSDEIKVLLIE